LKKKICLSKKEIDTLYKTGKKVNFSSLYLLWDFNKNLNDVPLRLVISVPKKKIKKAVDRNYIKRCIKEIYLLNKQNLTTKTIRPINIIIIYNKTHIIEFNQLQEELLTLFKKIITELNENY
tara:strand:+ start:1702 stop:2067 length:366 start_codon:yes stop_codon:yes gene_type:complete